MNIEKQIRDKISNIDVSNAPCAISVISFIDLSAETGFINSWQAEKFKEMANDAVRNQKRRLKQVAVLTRSQSMRLG